MQFVRRHWYNIGLASTIGAIAGMIAAWDQTGVLQKLALANFIALLLHQFEEYGWPGGEPAIMNIVLRPSDRPDRYPLNQNSAMVINVLASYGFYLIPVFFPHQPWLAIPPILFGFLQFVVHGIITNYKMKSFYNPGLAAVVLLHYPIGIAYLWYGHAHDLIAGRDWIYGLIYLAVFQLFFVKMTYGWLASENSKFIFADEEMQRFGVQAKLGRSKRDTA